jgi:hypothetical protein
MPKPAPKKKCANPNCSNPKCPFPHYENANEVNTVPPAAPKKKIEATSVPYSHREFLKLEKIKKIPPDQTETLTVAENPARDPTSTIIRVCLYCRQTFGLTAGEQIWYANKSYSLPKRCSDCRTLLRST